MFGVVLLVAVAAGYIYYVNKNMSVKTPEAEAFRAQLHSSRALYKRRHGPRFHREAVKPALPYMAIALTPFLITVAVTQDGLPVSLMAAMSVCVAAALLYGFNLQARRVYNENSTDEDYVSQSVASLDDFRIPDDWYRS